jgi:hypothetical protein
VVAGVVDAGRATTPEIREIDMKAKLYRAGAAIGVLAVVVEAIGAGAKWG